MMSQIVTICQVTMYQYFCTKMTLCCLCGAMSLGSRYAAVYYLQRRGIVSVIIIMAMQSADQRRAKVIKHKRGRFNLGRRQQSQHCPYKPQCGIQYTHHSRTGSLVSGTSFCMTTAACALYGALLVVSCTGKCSMYWYM